MTYRHLIDDAYVLGLPASESITVGGMTVAKSWGYDATTGFRQSQTIHGITTTFGADDFGNVAVACQSERQDDIVHVQLGRARGHDHARCRGRSRRSIRMARVASEAIAGRTTIYEYARSARPSHADSAPRLDECHDDYLRRREPDVTARIEVRLF